MTQSPFYCHLRGKIGFRVQKSPDVADVIGPVCVSSLFFIAIYTFFSPPLVSGSRELFPSSSRLRKHHYSARDASAREISNTYKHVLFLYQSLSLLSLTLYLYAQALDASKCTLGRCVYEGRAETG